MNEAKMEVAGENICNSESTSLTSLHDFLRGRDMQVRPLFSVKFRNGCYIRGTPPDRPLVIKIAQIEINFERSAAQIHIYISGAISQFSL